MHMCAAHAVICIHIAIHAYSMQTMSISLQNAEVLIVSTALQKRLQKESILHVLWFFLLEMTQTFLNKHPHNLLHEFL